jgi:[ribosomal protein S5]-alanine N-acetyltransferase
MTVEIHVQQPLRLETDRLTLRMASLLDAPFIQRLLNDPDFIQNIGDRGVRDLHSAEQYIRDRLLLSYEKNGFGLLIVQEKMSQEALGLAGLVKREGLDGIDLGFAFLPEFRGMGYAHEATVAIRDDARNHLNLPKLLGITVRENLPSIRVLEKVGMTFDRTIRLPNDEKELLLYSLIFSDR